jgi:hypothetical protein
MLISVSNEGMKWRVLSLSRKGIFTRSNSSLQRNRYKRQSRLALFPCNRALPFFREEKMMKLRTNRFARLSVVGVLTLVFAGTAIAQDAPDSSDHPMISRYAGSVIDGYQVKDFDDFDLPLGPMIKDADGNRVPSEKETLEGKRTRILYRGPEGRSTLEISRNYRSALEGAGFEILYNCSEEECGRLFYWALYHGDKIIRPTVSRRGAFDRPTDLRYIAAKKATDEGVFHVAVMIAIDSMWTKGPFTLLEVIEAEPMARESMPRGILRYMEFNSIRGVRI